MFRVILTSRLLAGRTMRAPAQVGCKGHCCFGEECGGAVGRSGAADGSVGAPGAPMISAITFSRLFQPLAPYDYARTFAHAYTRIRVHAYMRTRVYACTRTRLHAYMCIRAHTYTQSCVQIDTRTFLNIHCSKKLTSNKCVLMSSLYGNITEL